jgi:hypothetical protein
MHTTKQRTVALTAPPMVDRYRSTRITMVCLSQTLDMYALNAHD